MRTIIAFAVALVASVGWFAAAAPPQSDKDIQSIRQSYTAINSKQGRYRKVKKELAGFSTEGGELVAYFDRDAIAKIVATYYGETGRSREDYYYRDGKLIFVLRTESTYSRPLSGKVVRTKLSRFYFKDDKLIRWIGEMGKMPASDSSENQEQEADYLKASKQFVDGARSSQKTIESDQ